MKIKNIEIGNLFLAPMAGVSEVGFRSVCKLSGADLTYTEMVSCVALNYDNKKTKDLLITSEFEDKKAVQLFGHDENEFYKACQNKEIEKFDIIDLNFGCPAPKIVKNGDGSALLKDVPKIYKIVNSCVRATNKPISCKFRIGFGKNDDVSLDVARACYEAGASLLEVHGRTREQMYSGAVNLEAISKIKSSVGIPVVGNGDIKDIESYQKMLETGVDGVMIGRGALGDPNIFARLKGLKELDKLLLIEKHIQVLRQYFDERYVGATIKKHLLWYLGGGKFANDIKLKVATNENLDESFEIVKQYLKRSIKK